MIYLDLDLEETKRLGDEWLEEIAKLPREKLAVLDQWYSDNNVEENLKAIDRLIARGLLELSSMNALDK
jgi:transposase